MDADVLLPSPPPAWEVQVQKATRRVGWRSAVEMQVAILPGSDAILPAWNETPWELYMATTDRFTLKGELTREEERFEMGSIGEGMLLSGEEYGVATICLLKDGLIAAAVELGPRNRSRMRLRPAVAHARGDLMAAVMAALDASQDTLRSTGNLRAPAPKRIYLPPIYR